ncbi:MAG: CarD family transcriptional regulator [Holosporales bacterium]|jgi:CarD family transcriptional regulator|nr:CarD family transcriptional regulator [Holosporales bacterium]
MTHTMLEEGDLVVYPAHGVGRVMGFEQQTIAGVKIHVVMVAFAKDKLTLRLPVNRIESSGLRPLSSREKMNEAIKTLKTPSRTRRMMWSRRAQEYETKINSGDPLSIAQVVRDLHRSTAQAEQSYSERQIYQVALDRLMREYAAIEKIDEEKALEKLEEAMRAA